MPPRAHPEQQRRGPLKRIVKIRRKAAHKFDAALVELECGHIVKSNGLARARCDRCQVDP